MGPRTGKRKFSSREECELCGAAREVWFIMAMAERHTDWGVSEIVSLGNLMLEQELSNEMKKYLGLVCDMYVLCMCYVKLALRPQKSIRFFWLFCGRIKDYVNSFIFFK